MQSVGVLNFCVWYPDLLPAVDAVTAGQGHASGSAHSGLNGSELGEDEGQLPGRSDVQEVDAEVPRVVRLSLGSDLGVRESREKVLPVYVLSSV